MDIYKRLAQRLDSLPNGFPPTEDGAELRLLEYLYTEEEAILCADLRLTLETSTQIAERLGRDKKETRALLKQMTKRGLIKAEPIVGGFGFGLMPFVVGIYEYQVARIDEEMSRLFEDYYQKVFGQMLKRTPQVHRVVPVNQTIRTDLSVAPYENGVQIIKSMKSWGVTDCICRQQQAYLGNPCEHPLDVCLTFSERPGAFSYSKSIRELTMEEALATLQKAADAGLVHSTSNNQEGLWYICNCCTCSCGILRGLSELGIADVVASSSYVNHIDTELCNGCDLCVEHCQFDALVMNEDDVMTVNTIRCVGCGICVPHCELEAMHMVSRENYDVPPVTEEEWMEERARRLGVDLSSLK